MMSIDEEQEALLKRAAEEREVIFNRYALGLDPSNEVDSWENPTYEIYHITDKYGFMHDSRLPETRDAQEVQRIKIELERDKKWVKMVAHWNPHHEKLRKRVYKGIPDKFRWPVWKKLLHVEESIARNKNVYARMLELARKYSTEVRQIDSDVNRQFRDNVAFRQRYSAKQVSLFNVLNAYSIYNSELGYCQGMACVAGILLLYMQEEEAFWALNEMIVGEKYAMHGLFVEGFPKLNRFLEHHDRIMSKIMRKLHQHFIKHNVDAILYSIKWFFVIFVERIPFSLSLRVWDIFLLDGDRVVTAMAVTILYMHKNELLRLKDMDSIIEYLQVKLHKNFGYSDDQVIDGLERILKKLKDLKLDVPPPPKPNEFPTKRLGEFIEADVEKKIGRRRSELTNTEKQVINDVILRQQQNAIEEVQSTVSYETSECATGDAYSMKTYQSITSLATSAAVSSYSLCSTGYTIATPGSAINNNYNCNSKRASVSTPTASTPNRSSIVTLYDNEIEQHEFERTRAQSESKSESQLQIYENQIQIQISSDINNQHVEHFVKNNSGRNQYQNIIHINPAQTYNQQQLNNHSNNNINNNTTHENPNFLRNHRNYQTPTNHMDKYNNFKRNSNANASISNGIIQFSGNYDTQNCENLDDNNDDDDDDNWSVQNTRL